MSSDADSDAAAAATVALFDSLYTENYCDVAAAVLFIYDAFITLDRAVESFWTARPKRSGAAILFFANKWISMTIYVMDLVGFAPFPSDKAMQLLQFCPGAAFSSLRAYVLSRSKLLGSLIFVLSLAPVGANVVPYAYQLSGENFSLFGCLGTDNTSATLTLRFVSLYVITHTVADAAQGNPTVTIISRVPLIAADILLIYITWYKLSSWDALKAIRPSKRLQLSDVLFRGGTIYFLILFVLNILHLALSAAAIAGDGAWSDSVITEFTAPLTAVLISRFLLELQEVDQAVVKLDADDPLYSANQGDSTPSFISSLGGFVNPALTAQSDVEDDNDGIRSQVRSRLEGQEEKGGGIQAETSQ
ncbi:hypothetical protein OH76DRAFT_1489395 [Lentinus brumalis]|uniref:DUF6533 domain-containing protein n=1 Tax=Lentinus brumalis TaxID=2498619 RepID=A0A371CMQ7_9APHY|nr:hypothetical protein OH76DRAFT_1489395 [Polyporus brumalis]